MTDFVHRAAGTTSLLLGPVLAVQGRRLRKTVPRLAEPDNDEGVSTPTGSELTGDETRLLVFGDSMAAGVGIDDNENGIAGRMSQVIAERLRRPVAWRVVAKSGATARYARNHLVRRVRDPLNSWVPDIVVVCLGINDLMRFTPMRAWRSQVDGLTDELLARVGREATVVFSGVPPAGKFAALPNPLRAIAGIRARNMDVELRRVCLEHGVRHVPMSPAGLTGDPARFFASDRLHPSAIGYSQIASMLVEELY